MISEDVAYHARAAHGDPVRSRIVKLRHRIPGHLVVGAREGGRGPTECALHPAAVPIEDKGYAVVGAAICLMKLTSRSSAS